jgi:hypothetical protein
MPKPGSRKLHPALGLPPSSDDKLQQLLALDLEYRLTLAHRIDCDCAPYLARRREVLIPEILKEANNRGEDPVDTFHGFQTRLHARLCPDGPTHRVAGRFAALMGLVSDKEDNDG